MNTTAISPLLSKLEKALDKARQCFDVFDDLPAKATQSGISQSDYFTRIIYNTSYTGSIRTTISTRLADIALEQNIYSNENDQQNLIIEIRDAYQSLPTDKTAFFVSRLEKLMHDLTNFSMQLSELQEATEELRSRLPTLRQRATPDFIKNHEPQDADNHAKGYNENLPKTLETTHHVLYFLPQFKIYFRLYAMELTAFLLTEVYSPKTSEIVENKGDYWQGKENSFNSPMTLHEAEKWFMQLAKNNSKNGKPFLTVDQVQKFIDRAFVGETDVPKQALNFGSKERLTLWKLFYQFYQRCTSINNGVERGTQCRDKYIKLLTDNFTNFTFDEVKANFSKSNKVQKHWKSPI